MRFIPPLPDFVVCHIGETCSSIKCCIDVGIMDLSIQFELNLNLCDNTISVGFEKYHKTVFDALSIYQWGKFLSLLGIIEALT